jgi:hypothetical protein
MQIAEKCIQNLLVNIVLKKKNFICIYIYEKRPFHAFSLGMGWINSSLEVSCVWQLMELKVVLPKPALMNHHHWNFKNK